jgi:hypothetical protein
MQLAYEAELHTELGEMTKFPPPTKTTAPCLYHRHLLFPPDLAKSSSYIYGAIHERRIQQPQKAQLSHLPWRNWLARSTVRFASAFRLSRG